MAPLAIDEALLISIVFEATLYGISMLMFGMTLKVLLTESKGVKSNRIMIPAAIGLCLVGTMHLIVNEYRLVNALIYHRGSYEEPILWLSKTSEVTYVLKDVLYTVQVVIGDIIVVYRLYIVSRSRILALTLYVYVRFVKDPARGLFSSDLLKWVAAVLSATILTNLGGCTILAYNLWKADQSTRSFRTSDISLVYVARIVLDSGLIYAGGSVMIIVLYAAKSNAQYFFVESIVSLESIAFYMIMLRLSSARKSRENAGLGTSSSGGRTSRFAAPLQIELHTVTETSGAPAKASQSQNDI